MRFRFAPHGFARVVAHVAWLLAAGAGAAQPAAPQAGELPAHAIELECGLVVELVGVAPHLAGGAQFEQERPWWKPDGSPLADKPYQGVRKRTVSDQEGIARDFAVRVTRRPEHDVSVGWGFDPAGIVSQTETSGAHGAQDPIFIGAVAGMPEVDSCTVRLKVAAGPWRKKSETNADGGSAESGKEDFTWSPSSLSREGGVMITLMHNIEGRHDRIVCISKDGREIGAGRSESSSGTSGFTLISVTFPDVVPEDVERFEFQVRTHETVTFRNVSLHAGQKTDVEVMRGE